jgi:FlaA1/EpsC-like NDP-sugar epimerase
LKTVRQLTPQIGTRAMLAAIHRAVSLYSPQFRYWSKEGAMQLVAAIVLAGIILYYLRTTVIALNNAERYYTAFALVLTVAVVCLAILERYSAA